MPLHRETRLRDLRVDYIGSLVRPPRLKEVFARYDRDQATEQELHQAQDQANRVLEQAPKFGDVWYMYELTFRLVGGWQPGLGARTEGDVPSGPQHGGSARCGPYDARRITSRRGGRVCSSMQLLARGYSSSGGKRTVYHSE